MSEDVLETLLRKGVKVHLEFTDDPAAWGKGFTARIERTSFVTADTILTVNAEDWANILLKLSRVIPIL